MFRQRSVYYQRYEIKEHIKTGSISEIYTAKDLVTGKDLIVKVITASAYVEKEAANTIYAFARQMMTLDIPNVVKVVDVRAMEGYLCVILEKIDGITLQRFLEKKEKLTPKEALSLVFQICVGLNGIKFYKLYQERFIHPYLIPEDVYISTAGKVYLNNMFIPLWPTVGGQTDIPWHYYYSPSSSTHSNRWCYLIYSVGIILYELLTGEIPLKGDGSRKGVSNEHDNKDLPPVNNPVIDAVLAKCCDRVHENRYQSVEELIAGLKEALLKIARTAEPPKEKKSEKPQKPERAQEAAMMREYVASNETVAYTASSVNADSKQDAEQDTEIQAGVKKAIEYLGMDVLLNKKVLINALEDLQPDRREEREFLYRTYSNDLGQMLYRSFSDNGRECFAEIDNYLLNTCGFNPSWSKRFQAIFGFLITDDYRNSQNK